MKKSLVFLVIFLIIFNVTNNAFAEVLEEEIRENIPVNKVWKIKFSSEVNEETLEGNLLIKGDKGKVPVIYQVKGSIVEVEPLVDLVGGDSYVLEISNKVKNLNNKRLKSGIVLPFITSKKDEIEKVTESKKSKELLDNTVYLGSYKSEYDMEWNLLHDEYKKFQLVGISNKEKVGGFISEHGEELYGIKVGDAKGAVISKYGDSLEYIRKGTTRYNIAGDNDYGVYFIDGNYVTFFYDIHKNNEVSSILWVTEDVEMSKDGFFGKSNKELAYAFEDLMVELINMTRVKEGLKPLVYYKELNKVARSHSENMAENDFFSHTDHRGKTPADRVKEAGFEYRITGENLAYGQFSSIYAHEGLMNSLNHRDNILKEQYTHVGIGVAFKDDVPYYTIKFYTPVN